MFAIKKSNGRYVLIRATDGRAWCRALWRTAQAAQEYIDDNGLKGAVIEGRFKKLESATIVS